MNMALLAIIITWGAFGGKEAGLFPQTPKPVVRDSIAISEDRCQLVPRSLRAKFWWQQGRPAGRLTVTASLPGVPGMVASFPRWANIPESGRPHVTVVDYVNQHATAQYAPTIAQLFCVGSAWTQFHQMTVNGDDGVVQPPIHPPLFGVRSIPNTEQRDAPALTSTR